MSVQTTRRERREKQRARGGRGPRPVRGGRAPWVVPAIVIGLAIAAIFALRAAGVFEPAARIDPNDPKYAAAGDIGQRYPDEGRDHTDTQTVTYRTNPPTSGPHWSSPMPWATYEQQQPNERIVHNLEHGGIVIAYTGLANDEVAKLKSIVSGLRAGQFRKIVLEPYTGMNDARVAVSAWTWQVKLASVDEATIVRFIKAHYDGPDAPEPGVP